MTMKQCTLNHVLILAASAAVIVSGALLARQGDLQQTALAAPTPPAQVAVTAVYPTTNAKAPAVESPLVSPSKPVPPPAPTAVSPFPTLVKTSASAPRPQVPSHPRVVTQRPPFPAGQSAGKGKLPPFPAPGYGPLPAAAPALASGPAPSVLWLSGVIQGDPKVAVLRQGENRYFVKEGDSVGRDRVLSIGTHNVKLQRGRRTRTLRVGQY